MKNQAILIYLVWSLFYIYNTASKSQSQFSQDALSRKRILKEYKDIKDMGISMGVPFNSTQDEIGVRLCPTRRILEWHFSFTGIEGSAYEGGVYHGRIVLPPDYPRRAPSIAVLTPNGRWEVDKDICLSATAYHQETWDTSWNLRTLVMALRGHMLTYPKEIGAILSTIDRQKALALLSRNFNCKVCGLQHNDLLNPKIVEVNNKKSVEFPKVVRKETLAPRSLQKKIAAVNSKVNVQKYSERLRPMKAKRDNDRHSNLIWKNMGKVYISLITCVFIITRLILVFFERENVPM